MELGARAGVPDVGVVVNDLVGTIVVEEMTMTTMRRGGDDGRRRSGTLMRDRRDDGGAVSSISGGRIAALLDGMIPLVEGSGRNRSDDAGR